MTANLVFGHFVRRSHDNTGQLVAFQGFHEAEERVGGKDSTCSPVATFLIKECKGIVVADVLKPRGHIDVGKVGLAQPVVIIGVGMEHGVDKGLWTQVLGIDIALDGQGKGHQLHTVFFQYGSDFHQRTNFNIQILLDLLVVKLETLS